MTVALVLALSVFPVRLLLGEWRYRAAERILDDPATGTLDLVDLSVTGLSFSAKLGFDVKDHAAFVKKIESEGIKLDEPVRKSPTGSVITYITDPWGVRIEIIERAPVTVVAP